MMYRKNMYFQIFLPAYDYITVVCFPVTLELEAFPLLVLDYANSPLPAMPTQGLKKRTDCDQA